MQIACAGRARSCCVLLRMPPRRKSRPRSPEPGNGNRADPRDRQPRAPGRVTAAGEPPDRGFDALPVDNMEPQSDPVNLRPGAPADAARGSLQYDRPSDQAAYIKEKGEQYPAWVLDQMGIEIMLANRVEMGSSIQPPRFRWVPYADALMFPLDTARLASATPTASRFSRWRTNCCEAYLTRAV